MVLTSFNQYDANGTWIQATFLPLIKTSAHTRETLYFLLHTHDMRWHPTWSFSLRESPIRWHSAHSGLTPLQHVRLVAWFSPCCFDSIKNPWLVVAFWTIPCKGWMWKAQEHSSLKIPDPTPFNNQLKTLINVTKPGLLNLVCTMQSCDRQLVGM